VPTTKRDNSLAQGAGENDALKRKGYFERRPHPAAAALVQCPLYPQ
jgi:hypothetical protein